MIRIRSGTAEPCFHAPDHSPALAGPRSCDVTPIWIVLAVRRTLTDSLAGHSFILILLSFVALSTMAGHQALAQRTVPATDLLNPPATEWLTYGRTYDNQRFSPLTQVTAQNVAQLVPVAVYQMNV